MIHGGKSLVRMLSTMGSLYIYPLFTEGLVNDPKKASYMKRINPSLPKTLSKKH